MKALRADNPPLLMDRALPAFAFTRLECTAVDAEPDAVYAAARDLDLLAVHGPLFDLVTRARTLGGKLRGRMLPPPASMRVGNLFDRGWQEGQPWVPLGENPGRELVLGAIGKVWRPAIVWLPVTPGDFQVFHEPGWAKIAANLVVHPYGERRTLLTYEARTACTDEVSRKRFGRYWALASPGVGVVLRAVLRAIKEAAEAGPGFGRR